MPGRKSLPDTLRRSPAEAQRTWIKAHDNALEQYSKGETFGGIDYYGSTKEELYERAKKLDVQGSSGMSKKELARAIARKQ
jgi:uncharacterized protein YecT (DUF1311 family)